MQFNSRGKAPGWVARCKEEGNSQMFADACKLESCSGALKGQYVGTECCIEQKGAKSLPAKCKHMDDLPVYKRWMNKGLSGHLACAELQWAPFVDVERLKMVFLAQFFAVHAYIGVLHLLLFLGASILSSLVLLLPKACSSRNPNTLCGFVVLYLMLVQQAGHVSNEPSAASAVAAAAATAAAGADPAHPLHNKNAAGSYSSKDPPNPFSDGNATATQGGRAGSATAAHGVAGRRDVGLAGVEARQPGTAGQPFEAEHLSTAEAEAGQPFEAEHLSTAEAEAGQSSTKSKHRQAWANHSSQPEVQRPSTREVGVGQPSTADSFADLAELLGPGSLIDWMVWQEHSISH
eukprot:223751-Pelagomonas_calceolata.AAC.3